MGLFTVQTSWGIPFISPAYMALTFAALIFSHIYLYVYDHVKDTGQMKVWDWPMDRFVDQLLLPNFCADVWKVKASREVVSSLFLIVVLRGFCYRPFWLNWLNRIFHCKSSIKKNPSGTSQYISWELSFFPRRQLVLRWVFRTFARLEMRVSRVTRWHVSFDFWKLTSTISHWMPSDAMASWW